MRRLAAIAAVLALAGTGVTLIVGASAQGGDTHKFAVIFDDAKGLIGGQQVKVAGAPAGEITKVTVTPDFKARVEGSIDSKFTFYKNATCTIRPEGLIAENYVDCNPGTRNSGPIQVVDGLPTVPVTHTSEPISLLDLFNIFNLPTRERFQVIVDELGVGTAGRGDDFNDILLRANPALKLADQAIAVLTRQKAQLASIIDDTNTIAASGATHTQDLQNFLQSAANLSQTTASHANGISQTIQRLPGLLDQAQPSLEELNTLADQGTPLLKELRAAAPSLNRVANDLPRFTAVATPGLAKLGTAITKAIPTIRNTTPLVKTLQGYLGKSLPNTQLFGKLTTNLQQHGFFEGFLSVLYYISSALSREDGTSHLLSQLLVAPTSGCSSFASKPVAGCEAHYAAQNSGSTIETPSPVPSSTSRKAKTSHTTTTTSTSTQTAPAQTTTTTTATSTTPSPVSTLGNTTSTTVNNTSQALQNLLNYLTK